MILSLFSRLQQFTAPSSMGVVRDVLFVNCYWPKLDSPTCIFADGSSGIQVMGRTPRNVWFPDDVEFLPFYPDALYPAEQAVLKAFPFARRGLVNLSPAEALVWWEAYQEAVKGFPPTHTVLETPRHTNFLRHREVKSEREIVLKEDSVSTLLDGSQSVLKAGSVIVKLDYDEFIAELTPEECQDLMSGKVEEATLRAGKEFCLQADTAVTLDAYLAAKVK